MSQKTKVISDKETGIGSEGTYVYRKKNKDGKDGAD
jgi:hypothetical protein